MATSEDRKKKTRSAERHESRKKKREEGNSYSKSRHTKRSKSSRSSATTSKKVCSISELVKLVISGEVKVPKSLKHYVDDRAQLFDQIFTILSESDVRGMLPDILKGLKMRQVRQLCLDQLKNMLTDDVIEIVDPQSSKNTSLNLDATVFELLGPENEPGKKEDGIKTEAPCEDSSHNTEFSTGGGREEGEKTSGEQSIDINERDRVDLEPRNNQSNSVEVKTKTDVLTNENTGQDDGVCVSDVSSGNDSDDAEEEEEAGNSPTQTMECDTTTSELSIETTVKRRERESVVRGERERRQIASEEEEDCISVSSADSSLSDLEDCWLSDFPAEVSEWARLQEIEFRRRALEAELRKRGEGEKEMGRLETAVPSQAVPSQAVTAKVDKSEAIELQLRQRALQSLLVKKKEQNI